MSRPVHKNFSWSFFFLASDVLNYAHSGEAASHLAVDMNNKLPGPGIRYRKSIGSFLLMDESDVMGYRRWRGSWGAREDVPVLHISRNKNVVDPVSGYGGQVDDMLRKLRNMRTGEV